MNKIDKIKGACRNIATQVRLIDCGRKSVIAPCRFMAPLCSRSARTVEATTPATNSHAVTPCRLRVPATGFAQPGLHRR